MLAALAHRPIRQSCRQVINVALPAFTKQLLHRQLYQEYQAINRQVLLARHSSVQDHEQSPRPSPHARIVSKCMKQSGTRAREVGKTLYVMQTPGMCVVPDVLTSNTYRPLARKEVHGACALTRHSCRPQLCPHASNGLITDRTPPRTQKCSKQHEDRRLTLRMAARADTSRPNGGANATVLRYLPTSTSREKNCMPQVLLNPKT